ncbi:hypothetical protein ACM15_24455 [Parabacteroides goldsteinii]|uniref:Carrier domain-containing protein n=1 Tax=Parabacteroides goldsteinii TaxID=328812 RepID=A0A0J6CG28_9BACT|nr:acyl carrier protein [Parabacteroides goldsteinii]KMM31079.1 hypothetical protein ACM15_24455 [Parabacteroides goldsteinii]
METKEKIVSIIAATLEVEPSQITLDMSVGDLPKWDSLGHLAIIQNIQDEFDIELEAEEIIELEDVNDIIKIVDEKLR